MISRRRFLSTAGTTFVWLLATPACSRARTRRGNAVAQARPVNYSTRGAYQVGLASWYGAEFAGRRTANGERFNPDALTAAHRSLPFGTRVRVTDLETGRRVVVRINDRGPFKAKRVIDLSRGAARHLNLLEKGLARVRLDIIDWPSR